MEKNQEISQIGMNDLNEDRRSGLKTKKTRIFIPKETLINALNHTKSLKATASYLQINVSILKKWLWVYEEENGEKLIKHYRKYFLHNLNKDKQTKVKRGIKKVALSGTNKEEKILHIFENGVFDPIYKHNELFKVAIKYGYLKEECSMCKMSTGRLIDEKKPLIVYFKNKNVNDWHKNNIETLCLNCTYIHISDETAEDNFRKLMRIKTKRNHPLIEYSNPEDIFEQVIGTIEKEEKINNEDDLYKYVTRNVLKE